MVSRSSAIDGLTVAAGIVLLSQSIGAIEGIIFYRYPYVMIFGAIWAVLFVSAGAFLLHRVHVRRKKRKAVEKEAMELHTPIGISIVSIRKSGNSRQKGVILVTYFLLIGGVIGILFGIWVIRDSSLQSSQNDVLFDPLGTIVIGVSSVIGGYGLLRRKRWGWRWSVIWFFACTGSAALDFFVVQSSEIKVSYIGQIITNLLILYYLYRSYVKAYFGITLNNPLVGQK